MFPNSNGQTTACGLSIPFEMNHNPMETILRECLFFRGFQAADLRALSKRCHEKQYADGELICARGTPGTEFYIVLGGLVEIVIPRSFSTDAAAREDVPDPREISVRTVKPCEFFGEIACLEEGGTRTASARAVGQCHLVIVPRDAFLATAQSHAPAAMSLVRHLATRVRHYTDSLAQNKLPTAPDKPPETPSVWERIANTATAWSVHWTFTALNVALWVVWFAIFFRAMWKDVPTMNGLSLLMSIVSFLMTILILVAENRAERRDQFRIAQENRWALHSNESINQLNERIAQLEKNTAAIALSVPHKL